MPSRRIAPGQAVKGLFTSEKNHSLGAVLGIVLLLGIPLAGQAFTRVIAWGDNSTGQADVPAGLTNVVAVAGGLNHSLALKADGTVVAWGTNNYGQTSVPAGLANVTAIAAAGHRSLALKSDGTVITWGYVHQPPPPDLTNVTAIAGCGSYDLALRTDGSIVVFGYQSAPTTAAPSNAVAISACDAYSLAIVPGGQVVNWKPSPYGPPSQEGVPADLTNAIAVAAGSCRAMALRDDGTLTGWTAVSPPPGVIGALPRLTNVIAISSPGEIGLALRSDGTAVSWNWRGLDSPWGPAVSNIVAIAAGDRHALAVINSSPWPALVAQPRSQTVLVGADVVFEGLAVSDTPLQYQWLCDGRLLPAETNATLTLRDVQLSQQGRYAVRASNPYGYHLSPPAQLTVLAPRVELVQTNYIVWEHEAVVQIEVRRGNGTPGAFSVGFATTNGSAQAGIHYMATNGTLSFSAGEINKLVEIPLINNTLVDGDKTLRFSLRQPNRAVLGTAEATITVLDNDSTVAFSKATYGALERQGSVSVKIIRGGELTQSAGVGYLTTGGTATPGVDYTAIAGTLAFAPGQTNAEIEVPLLPDDIVEGSETIGLVLTNATGSAVLASPAQAVLTITEGADNTLVDLNEDIMQALLDQGGLIRLNVDGAIPLSRTLVVAKDAVLDGSGQQVTLSGMNAVRVLHVNPGISLTLSNVTIADGRSDRGAGLYNFGGAVTVSGCTFTNNQARGSDGAAGIPGESAAGGAVFNEGDLRITYSTFIANGSFSGRGADAPLKSVAGDAQGGAVYSLGRLWIAGSSFLNNQVVGGSGGNDIHDIHVSMGIGGPGGQAGGGAIYNEDQAEVISSTFIGNAASGGNGGGGSSDVLGSGGRGGDAEAGGIHNSGTLSLTNCSFSLNRVVGGSTGHAYTGPRGADARGGAIFNLGSMSVFSNCCFTMNEARAGYGSGYKGPTSGFALGGAIFNTGTVHIADAVIGSNRAGTGEAAGGGIYHAGGLLDLAASVLAGNECRSSTAGDGYHGGPGYDAFGGGIFNAANASVRQCLVISNSVLGGPAVYGLYSGNGGNAFGAGIASRGFLEVSTSSFQANSVTGAEGLTGVSYGGGPTAETGGAGSGGAAALLGGTASFLNTTISGCSARGGNGLPAVPSGTFSWGYGASGGAAFGGGVFITNAAVYMTNCTVTRNLAIPGLAGEGFPHQTAQDGKPGKSFGDGVFVQTNATMLVLNTIVALNAQQDMAGAYNGSGNLIGIDACLGVPFTNALGTISIPLMPDSPAIDAGVPVPGVDSDQRGVSRPYGSAPDIGAYEWNGTSFYQEFTLTSLGLDGNNWVLKGGGPTNQVFRLRASADLIHWTDVSTNSSDALGLFQLSETMNSAAGARFWQVVSP